MRGVVLMSGDMSDIFPASRSPRQPRSLAARMHNELYVFVVAVGRAIRFNWLDNQAATGGHVGAQQSPAEARDPQFRIPF
jgi:hypothetical protein